VTAAIHISLGDVAATLTLVAVAVAVAVWERTDLEADIAVAAARSFIQLTAIGYVINAIFASDSILWVALLLAVMVVFGALLYLLLGAVALATLLAVLLSRRTFFTTEHQLQETPAQSTPGA
jgi:ABC-type iron transport system FetAB permease component